MSKTVCNVDGDQLGLPDGCTVGELDGESDGDSLGVSVGEFF